MPRYLGDGLLVVVLVELQDLPVVVQVLVFQALGSRVEWVIKRREHWSGL